MSSNNSSPRSPSPSPWRKRLRAGYHALMDLLAGQRGLRRTLPDGEVVTVLRAYRYLTWNDLEYRSYKQSARPGSVVFDIGANAGGYSILFGKWVGPTGKVFAFEPAPEAFAGLAGNVAVNDLGAVVTPVRAAVSDQAGEASFVADGFQGTNHLIAPGETQPSPAPVVQVRCVTVDAFCAQEKVVPDVMKIDVEGAELFVLRGATATIRAAGKKLILFIELHPLRWAGFGYSLEEIRAEFARQGLEIIHDPSQPDPWTTDSGLPVRVRPL